MQDLNAEVNVLLTAFFEGGSTAGLLTAGRIKFHGAFTQTDINSTSSYQASDSHFSEFVLGQETPSILFANPGFGATESRFWHLSLEDAGGNTLRLRSDVYASAQLLHSTFLPVTIEASQAPYRRLFTEGAAANNVTFRGISWTISDGIAISSTLNNLVFVDQDPTVTQLAIRRAGGSFGLLNPTFSTAPTTGKYLELEDVLNDASVLTVNVTSPTPGFHGGFAVTGGGAVLNGWPATQGGQIRADASPGNQRDH
jgi:hypothetical protein